MMMLDASPSLPSRRRSYRLLASRRPSEDLCDASKTLKTTKMLNALFAGALVASVLAGITFINPPPVTEVLEKQKGGPKTHGH